jgi:hypothetical protein
MSAIEKNRPKVIGDRLFFGPEASGKVKKKGGADPHGGALGNMIHLIMIFDTPCRVKHTSLQKPSSSASVSRQD